MKKNMKKYSVREVMEIACDEKMVLNVEFKKNPTRRTLLPF